MNPGRFRIAGVVARMITSCLRTLACACSFHPGGVNVARMDGSVRFVESTVTMAIWCALGTSAGGEAFRDDAY
jgi:prepilin-type processing-associated H-X9-DG protein